MLKTPLALITSATLGLVATVQADITWDWTYTGYFGGTSPLVSGSGTLTTGPLSGVAYPITSITGTFAGSPITGLDTSFSPVPFAPDQMLYTPGGNGFDNNVLGFLTGIGFDTFDGTTTDVVDIFDFPIISTLIPYVAIDANTTFGNAGVFTAVAAPEPSQIISMLTLAGVGGAGLMFNLRRRK